MVVTIDSAYISLFTTICCHCCSCRLKQSLITIVSSSLVYMQGCTKAFYRGEMANGLADCYTMVLKTICHLNIQAWVFMFVDWPCIHGASLIFDNNDSPGKHISICGFFLLDRSANRSPLHLLCPVRINMPPRVLVRHLSRPRFSSPWHILFILPT